MCNAFLAETQGKTMRGILDIPAEFDPSRAKTAEP
jgi:hypothetical protein